MKSTTRGMQQLDVNNPDIAIFQQLWNNDENGYNCYLESNGAVPKHDGVAIIVRDQDPNPTLFCLDPPDSQIAGDTFAAVESLFGNYHVDDGKNPPDVKTVEVNNFIDKIAATKVLDIARQYVIANLSNDYNDLNAWKEFLKQVWFHDYTNPNAQSAFEHVFVGDVGRKDKRSKELELGGHHFWYKFYLEDTGELSLDGTVIGKDLIRVFSEPPYSPPFGFTNETACISYALRRLNMVDGSVTIGESLHKHTGGYFIGVSPEFLIAFGAVIYTQYQNNKQNDVPIVLNNTNYVMKVYAPGKDGNPLRTFYPTVQ